MNARFWIIAHGDKVKLTLKPGEEKRWVTRTLDSEGWSRTVTGWTFDGQEVVEKSRYDGQDCDGGVSAFEEWTCPVNDLDTLNGMPLWIEGESDRRDYEAEAAGY